MKSKTEFNYRWFMVAICSLSVSFFSYTSQDLATQHDAYKQFFSDQIDSKDFDFYFNTLYSTSLFIIIFLDVYVGAMADKYGPGILFIIQASCIATGQFIFLCAIRYQQFALLYIGRFLIYSANSTTLVSNSIMISQYFTQKEMGLATGVTTTTGVLGVALNLQLAPRLTQWYGLFGSSFFTLCLVLIAFIFITTAFTIDKTLDNSIRENTTVKTARRQSIKSNNFFKEIQSLSKTYWFFNNSCFISNVCGTMIGIVGPAFLTENYNMTPQQAGQIASLLPIASISVPFMGKIVDSLGKPIIWMIASGILNSIGCFGMTQGYPALFFAIFGVSYAIRIATTMPILTLVVGNAQRGKAYGLIRSFRDVSGFLFTMLNGWLHNVTGSYKYSLYLFSALGLLVSVFAFLSNREVNKEVQDTKVRRATRKATLTDRKSKRESSFITSEQIRRLQEKNRVGKKTCPGKR